MSKSSGRAFSLLLCCCGCLTAQAIAIRTSELPPAIKDVPYHGELLTSVSGRCPMGNAGLSIKSGQLPKGLELFSFGIQGTPRQTGYFRFTLLASNVCVSTAKEFDLLVTRKPTLLVSPRSIAFQYRAGSADLPQDTVRVEGGVPEQAYSIDSSQAPWLQVEPSEGRIPDPDAALSGDRVRLRVNPSGIAPGVYHAVLKFYMENSANVPAVDVSLEVLKAN